MTMLIPDPIHNLIHRRAGDRLRADVEEGVSLADSARHEAGHIVLIEHVGGRVLGRTHIAPDGSGATGQPWFPEDTTLACHIATSLAGVMAQGVHLDHWDGSDDKAYISELLDEVSLEEGLAAMEEAYRIARYGLKVNARRLTQLARRLEKTGRV